MWIVKGVVLGVVIFIVGGISYTVIRMGSTMYRLAQSAKGASRYYAIAFHVRGNIHDPVFWVALFVAIVIGIWIVRARTTHNPAGSVDSTTQNYYRAH